MLLFCIYRGIKNHDGKVNALTVWKEAPSTIPSALKLLRICIAALWFFLRSFPNLAVMITMH